MGRKVPCPGCDGLMSIGAKRCMKCTMAAKKDFSFDVIEILREDWNKFSPNTREKLLKLLGMTKEEWYQA